MTVSKEAADLLAAAFTNRSVVEIEELVSRFSTQTSHMGDTETHFIQFAGELWSVFCSNVGEEVASRGVGGVNEFVAQTNAALDEAITCPNCDEDGLIRTGDVLICACGYSEIRG